MRPVPIAIAAVLLSSALHGAEVYRSVDANGNVSYSDRPFSRDAETIVITTPHVSSPPPAPATPAAADSQPQASEPEQPPPPQPTARELAAEREANCAAARERNDRYQMSRRLYRSLPNGEREYLSDEELDAAKAGAAADVEKWCN